jgi:hypothetical protein
MKFVDMMYFDDFLLRGKVLHSYKGYNYEDLGKIIHAILRRISSFVNEVMVVSFPM